ncbi:MAG: sugar ABC transporter substrate-binding protein [Microbacterium sp.]|uniref:sugar ABC transporter substrate-binding protein n=1 Tax=Microbacterium sp. TaxID=51671 RepID=UPI0039E2CFD2
MLTKKSWRLTAGSVAAVAAIAMLAACSSNETSAGSVASGSDGSPITIGFSPFNQSAEALVSLAAGVQSYAESMGDTVLIADPNNDAALQVQQTTAWIENGQIDALWFMANDGPSMAQVITAAQTKGIPVLANGLPGDYGLDGVEPGVSFSTLSYEKYGESIGEQVAACVADRLGGSATALLVTAPAGSTGDADMIAGIKDTLAAESPDTVIVNEANGDNDRLTSQNVVASAIQANPDADVLITVNDEGTLGGISALQAAGKDPSQMCIVGGGGGDEALAAVSSGDVYAIAAVDFAGDLTQNVDLLVQMAADPTADGVQLTTPITVTTK